MRGDRNVLYRNSGGVDSSLTFLRTSVSVQLRCSSPFRNLLQFFYLISTIILYVRKLQNYVFGSSTKISLQSFLNLIVLQPRGIFVAKM